MTQWPWKLAALSLALIAAGARGGAAQETKAVEEGILLVETGTITMKESPSFILTPEKCASATPGWRIVPDSVKTEVVSARLTDPSGDPDWKAEAAEGRVKLLDNNTRICMAAYCQAPTGYLCEITVRAGWREQR